LGLLSVDTTNIIDGCITSAKLAAGSVGNTNIIAGSISAALMSPFVFAQTMVTIAPADIVGTGVGQLSSAAGYPLLAAGGANVYIEWLSSVFFYKFVNAAYNNGGAGNIRITEGAGGTVISANHGVSLFTVGAGTYSYNFIAAASGVDPALTPNVPIYLQATTPYTNPGTAAGSIVAYSNYRIYGFS